MLKCVLSIYSMYIVRQSVAAVQKIMKLHLRVAVEIVVQGGDQLTLLIKL